MIEVNEQCKSCFHFQVCANVLKQQLFIREKMLKEEKPKCENYIPTADVVEVKHGRWENTDDSEYRCTNCNEYFCVDVDMHPIDDCNMFYCCNCGAKMDLKEGADNESERLPESVEKTR